MVVAGVPNGPDRVGLLCVLASVAEVVGARRLVLDGCGLGDGHGEGLAEGDGDEPGPDGRPLAGIRGGGLMGLARGGLAGLLSLSVRENKVAGRFLAALAGFRGAVDLTGSLHSASAWLAVASLASATSVALGFDSPVDHSDRAERWVVAAVEPGRTRAWATFALTGVRVGRALSGALAQGVVLQLRSLTLELCDLPFESLRDLLAPVAARGVLEALRLARCGLTDEDVVMALALLPIASVQALDLAGNEIGQRGLMTLARYALDPSCALHTLSVARQRSAGPHLGAFCGALAGCRTLTSLDLSRNRCGDSPLLEGRGLERLISGEGACQLSFLDLTGNELSGLFPSMPVSASLREIRFDKGNSKASPFAKLRVCARGGRPTIESASNSGTTFPCVMG